MIRRRAAAPALACLVLSAAALAGCDSPGLSRKAKSPAEVAKKGGEEPVGSATTTGADGLVPLDGQGAGGADTHAVQTQGLSVSDAISRACGIPARADGRSQAPSFDFDSAALAEEDRELLGQIAKCLTEGALRGKRVKLVGRADPRGEHEYNMTLGESRADAVFRYMVDLGVAKAQMRATSRGELDAKGTDESTWADDRRVDVELE